MSRNKIVEQLFFFGLLGIVAYIMWQIISPFIGALALAAILATVSYPIYERVLKVTPRKNKNLASFLSLLVVIVIIVTPLTLIGYFIVNEAVTFYSATNKGEPLSLTAPLTDFESVIQDYFPNFDLDVEQYAAQGAEWLASNAGNIFAGTASTIFLLFIAFFGIYYLFKDGKEFTKQLVYLSPLPDNQDERIIERLSRSVRTVVGGVLTVAIIQGTLSGIGFAIVGVEQAALLGSVAAIGALIPGIGTTVVFVPIIILLILNGSIVQAIILAVWAMLAVGLVDNVLGPKLMSRGTTLHPFLVLISALGGIALFGPIGFILGPVTLSFFMVMLELYSLHISPNAKLVHDTE